MFFQFPLWETLAGVKQIAHFSLQILHQLVLELIFGNYRQHLDLQFLREVS